MKKFLIAGMAIAMLAIPAVASASVNVDDAGNGFVGKGDVQNALGLANDQAMQAYFLSPGVKFTTSYTKVDDNTLNCTKYVVGTGLVNSGTIRQVYTQSVTQDAKATANTNNAGKLSNGWNLNGFDGPATYGPQTWEYVGTCPSGFFPGTTVEQDFYNTSRSGLMVNGVPLPNTPVEVAPVV